MHLIEVKLKGPIIGQKKCIIKYMNMNQIENMHKHTPAIWTPAPLLGTHWGPKLVRVERHLKTVHVLVDAFATERREAQIRRQGPTPPESLYSTCISLGSALLKGGFQEELAL